MAQSCRCLHIIINFLHPPGPNHCMPYLSPYHQPVPNSPAFCENVEISWKWENATAPLDWEFWPLYKLTDWLTGSLIYSVWQHTALTTTWPHYYCYVSLHSQDLRHVKSKFVHHHHHHHHHHTVYMWCCEHEWMTNHVLRQWRQHCSIQHFCGRLLNLTLSLTPDHIYQ